MRYTLIALITVATITLLYMLSPLNTNKFAYTTSITRYVDGSYYQILHKEGNKQVVAVIPGGGYKNVVISEGFDKVEWILSNGFDVAYLHYALGKYPVSLNTSSNLLHEVCNKYGISNTVVAGVSVGAQLALLNVLKSELHPKALILISPITDINYGVPAGVILNLNEGVSNIPRQLLTDNSPSTFYKPNCLPPCFIAHNSRDNVVPSFHSILLSTKLIEYGQKFDLHLYDSHDHGFAKNPPWVTTCAEFLKSLR